MKKLKKIITAVSVNAIVITIATQGVFATNQIDVISAKTENQIEDLISVENGYFDISEQDAKQIISLVGRECFQTIEKTLENYNTCVDDNEIEITENGTVINSDDSSLNVQGGNTTKQVSYWWGIKNYMSYTTAKRYISKLTSINSGVATVTKICGLYGSVVGLASAGLSVTAAGVVSLIGGAVSWYVNGVRNTTNKVFKKLPSNHKTGLVVEFKIWLAYSAYRQ